MNKAAMLWRCALCVFILAVFVIVSSSAYGKDDKISPREPGVYIKTDKGLKRLLPNIVFTTEDGVYYIVSNNPARFILKDVEYFVFFGQYDFQYLTLNPM